MRQFRIVPVPTPDTKPVKPTVELHTLDCNTVVEHDSDRWVVYFNPKGDHNTGIVRLGDFSGTRPILRGMYGTRVGLMVQGVYVPDPEPTPEWPMVCDMPFATIVEWDGSAMVKTQSVHYPCGWTLQPMTWGTAGRPSKPISIDLRARILGTLQPMTLADFSPEVQP